MQPEAITHNTIHSHQTTRTVICDIEANALYKPSKIWCIVCKDAATGEIFKFRPKSPFSGHVDFKEEFLEFAKTVKLWIGHNFIAYDMPNINRLFEQEVIKLEDVLDTLVLSRLFRPVSPFDSIKGDNRHGGHSLEAWGYRLGKHKIQFDDFSKYSEEQLEYCVGDVELNLLVYLELVKEQVGFSAECIDLEHNVAYLLWQQEQNGFYLDRVKALKLLNSTTATLVEMDAKLQILFPPLFKLVKNLVPKINKDGTLGKVSERILNSYQSNPDCKAEKKDDGSYDLFVKEVFNPQSTQQVAQRLLAVGWKPKNYTDKGNIKTDKVTMAEALTELLADKPNLEPLRCLQNYSIVADRQQKVQKWLALSQLEEWYVEGKPDGRVHGRVNPIGAGTHRCSHYDDNMANIARVVTGTSPAHIFKNDNVEFSSLRKFDPLPGEKLFLKHYSKNGEELVDYALTGLQGAYGWDSRDCWSVPANENLVLVGADAAGIQLRALAHYMNDKTYTQALLEGDIHVVNQQAAGIKTRNIAKTFIYAWLLGAGDEKIGTIVGVTEQEYDELIDYAKTIKKWGRTLLENIINNLRDKGRKADKRTVCIVIKGYRTKENFLNKTPALRRLRKEDIPAATKAGYLIGLDGRKLWIPNEHLAMSLYLQGFEAVIMKEAMVGYSTELKKLGVPFKQVAFVHDEFQIETQKEFGPIVGETVVTAIRKAGEKFSSNCPLDGEYKLGKSWAETH